MASKFQNRLVGTIILVAIGVIVLPDVLDGKKNHYQEEIASIPLKPELDSELESFEILDPVDDSQSLPDTPVDLAEPLDANTADDQPLEVVIKEVPERNEYQESGWIIQLMALKNAENAKNLVKDLQKRGYQAHTKPENGFTRVIIGPDVSKSKLERQIIELEKITGSKGQLLKFKPLNP
ncbi:SPOR domain-containing protein [Vibrio sp. JPW-9-11-11]|uniref:SPOR domain-containing protein n=1 Tax=Vibrio sp. JPW-9-11-11 TaxID=1416532 RepID=UPI0015944F61|nr:SPOR domain-containing protein [Vibrio sp. JPW-9-11-11]NVD06162.1 SPOR domain-containing protein [Vibrio sp. JPW-9-11-11]